MKLILILSFLFSLSSWAGEVKIVLDKPSVLTGEIVSGTVSNYQGPVINETLLEESVYLLHLDDERVELVFVQPMTTNTIKLNENDYLIWDPVEIIKVEDTQEIQLVDQKFELKSYMWIVYVVSLVLCVALALWVYFVRIKHYLAKKKIRKALKGHLFMAHDLDGITLIWRQKQTYLEAFPFIEEEFNKFEVTFYKYAFKPEMSDEERNEIISAYERMLDNVRGGSFGV